MLTKDPILTAMQLRLQRLVVLLVLSVVVGLAIFSGVITQYFDLTWRDIWPHLRAAWPPAVGALHELLLWGSAIIGLLLSSLLFCSVALWWRDTGTVHRRGTRFIDNRRH